jgi:hypothetical protein
MAAAAKYRTRLEWFKRVLGTPDAFGDKPGAKRSRDKNDTYPSQGFLWGSIEDASGGRQTEKESERQVTTATIKLRNRPGVVAGDQLRDAARNEVWTIRTVTQSYDADPNETVCEVDR